MAGSRLVILTLATLLNSGCGAANYYSQAVGGEIAVLRARQPIADLLAEPGTDPTLRRRLALVRDAREWAIHRLDLPDNGSYRSYADVKRPYVVWNVFATREFSVAPIEHCFPVAGCVGYQGWFRESAARASADALARQGNDVYVSGVPAYSTLGWFDDPLLSTMLRWDDATLLSTVFHELAHQKLYVKHDTRFNESFAEFVGEQGLREYRAQHALPAGDDPRLHRERSAQFTQLVLATRARAAALYREPLAPAAMRERKAAVFEQLRQDYRALRDTQWQGYAGYDRFFDGPLNNARLLPFGLYDDALPAFAALFADAGCDWPRFYAAVRRLAALDDRRRDAELETLKARAPAS
jgi:predicted aminopeptidase